MFLTTVDDALHSNPAPDVRMAVAALAVDAVSAEVIGALRSAGIHSILLRGPALARLLYDDALRPYGDVDLLVAPSTVREAENVLANLGFNPAPDIVHFQREHASTWRRAGGINVDLHHTMVGIAAPPTEVWELLSVATEVMPVGGIDADVLTPSASAMQVALHAAQHGRDVEKPMNDLQRAVERLPSDVWRAAAEMADTLEATPAFAAGLRLVPAGEQLAARLRLPRAKSAEIALRARTPPPVSRGIARLGRTRGVGAKAKLLAREVVPETVFMRRRSTLARKGRLGLLAAYACRPFWLLWHLGPAVRAWRRAQKEANESSAADGDAS